MENKNTDLVNKIQKVRKCKRSSARTYASTIVRVGKEFANMPCKAILDEKEVAP